MTGLMKILEAGQSTIHRNPPFPGTARHWLGPGRNTPPTTAGTPPFQGTTRTLSRTVTCGFARTCGAIGTPARWVSITPMLTTTRVAQYLSLPEVIRQLRQCL